jgi:glucose-1-phosphate adenylyltransferase
MLVSDFQHKAWGEDSLHTVYNQKSLMETNVIAMVLAGGRGRRLYPLTEHRAKPAVPFGGNYRLIDFVLSNMVNSHINEIYILTQYKSHSLLNHLQQGWAITHPMNGYKLMPVPPQMEGRETWYLGTADAVFQNMGLITKKNPDLVLVFGSDHIYSMDIRHMIQYHLEKKADVTVATIPRPVSECSQFGTVSVNQDWRITRFEEKTSHPTPIPEEPDQALVSMGNYVFNSRALVEELKDDSVDRASTHDFGIDILPKICRTRRVYAFDFHRNVIPGAENPCDYWRDVGTIESYYRANMEMNNPLSHLNLYNSLWPVRSVKYHVMPTKIIKDPSGRLGHVENSILGGSVVVSGGHVRNSVIGHNVYIGSGAEVRDSVILGNVMIKERALVHRAIIDHGNIVKEGERIGYDRKQDSSRYYMDKSGIVVLPHRQESFFFGKLGKERRQFEISYMEENNVWEKHHTS